MSGEPKSGDLRIVPYPDELWGLERYSTCLDGEWRLVSAYQSVEDAKADIEHLKQEPIYVR